MKTLLALLLLSIFCNGNPHYLVEAVAYPNIAGTYFQTEDGNVWSVGGDRYSGKVVLVMDSNETDDIHDDAITAVIEK